PRTPLAFLTTTMRRAPRSTLFPYTTLFRSGRARRPAPRGGVRLHQGVVRRQVRRRPYHSDRQEGPARSMSTDVLRIENLNKVFEDRKSTRLNSSHVKISYAVFCLKKKKKTF